MLKVHKVRDVKTPERSGLNAGFDFFVPNEQMFNVKLRPNENLLIPSGIKVRLPKNHVLIAFNKSGIAYKRSLIIGACVIDENYTGEIGLNVINVGNDIQNINPGMKLAQFILIKQSYHNVEVCEDLDKMYKGFNVKERGPEGFGSTGEK